jgi:hypothetical protein
MVVSKDGWQWPPAGISCSIPSATSMPLGTLLALYINIQYRRHRDHSLITARISGAYYKQTFLKNESESSIAWIGSL